MRTMNYDFKVIECFFINHNEMDVVGYEKEIRKMGIHSDAYRDLSMNFIQYNNNPPSISDIFNLFYPSPDKRRKNCSIQV